MVIAKYYCDNCGYKIAAFVKHKVYIDAIDANCPACKGEGTMKRQSPDPGENVKVIKSKKEERRRRFRR